MEMVVADLKKEFGFEYVSWLDEPKTVLTNVGKKKLSYWRERDLLEYHLNFRDRFFSQYGLLCNRMIRTLDGDGFIQYGDFYITVHDLIEESYTEDLYPEMKGYLLSALVGTAKGITYSPKYAYSSKFPYRETLKALATIKPLYPKSYTLLVNLIPEVKKRLLLDKPSILPPAPYGGYRLKRVMGQLFFEASDAPPLPAYKWIVNEIHLWFKSMTVESFTKSWGALLNGVDDEMQAYIIQSVIEPWEWRSCILALQQSSHSDQKIKQFEEEWEATKNIISTLQLSISDRRVSIK
ncbi:hypothetical protein JI666_07010 [Bacillus sp. NTK071]|uniref:hypothetical protein n=1 Tax=Bacillus sp. NTK071 TaxID=2802175 RepID=UPI001A8C68AA|nr:hypothetical protein [Bacillus sp. NTK071]MBN8208488.1 hypothetical protein [Bacillus sp. NTK071]